MSPVVIVLVGILIFYLILGLIIFIRLTKEANIREDSQEIRHRYR